MSASAYTSKYIHGTAPSEQERLALLNRLTNPPFIDFLELDGDETILDVGSGLGILAREITERIPRGKIVGLEYSAVQLAAARQNARANIYFCRGDAHALPFKDARFDVVFCRYVLEHVADPLQVLEEMRRVLKPGAKVFVQENNILINEFYPECPRFEALWEQFAELQSRLGGDALIGKKLLALLKKVGFQEIELSIQPEVHYSGQSMFGPWIENQIGNVRASIKDLVQQNLASEQEIALAIEELEAFARREDAAAWFYWNRAKAVR